MTRVYASILVLVCITVQSVVNGANICFDCTNLDAPDDCKQFHPCDDGQRCYKEVEETDNGTAAFNWGCASQLLCDLEAGTAARKKRISTERCFQCCDGNFCNFGPCTLDYCAAVTCQNGGSCNNEALKATCSCRDGFTGEFCEIEINECASSPCQNGATCLDLVGKYQCSCVAGYTGQNCELGIDECLSNPCLNGGTCIDAVNSYSCNCVPGFTGIFCETNINECESSPCRNSGTCTDMVNEYSCTCIPGITGKNCEINIDDCENVDCQNNGTCIDRINRFTCDCDYGFTGKLCETSLGRVCYNCTDADSVSECQSRTICGQNEECYIEHELTFAQKFRFTLGCVPSSLCSFLQGSGKRNAVALQLCYECCDENGCNHHACADTRGLGANGK